MKEDMSAGNQMPGYVNGISAKGGYLIDENGKINFPLIGEIQLAGLTRTEATNLIQNKLREFINDAIVTLRIQNFKITILGDVKIPGTYNIPNERLTLIEAIGLAGDLNITGVRNNVLVIREENGIKKEYRLDLTKNDIFTSPVYYLNQNDVVYVEPNRAKRNTSIVSSTAGIFISVASLVITTINVIIK
jgi:polysaccharide export outer membrane protein